MSAEHDGILSPEDEALFDTSINRWRKKVDRSTVLFVAVLIGVSMLAGLVGGIPAAALSYRCEVVDG
jgi:hypothetical protein